MWTVNLVDVSGRRTMPRPDRKHRRHLGFSPTIDIHPALPHDTVCDSATSNSRPSFFLRTSLKRKRKKSNKHAPFERRGENPGIQNPNRPCSWNSGLISRRTSVSWRGERPDQDTNRRFVSIPWRPPHPPCALLLVFCRTPVRRTEAARRSPRGRGLARAPAHLRVVTTPTVRTALRCGLTTDLAWQARSQGRYLRREGGEGGVGDSDDRIQDDAGRRLARRRGGIQIAGGGTRRGGVVCCCCLLYTVSTT